MHALGNTGVCGMQEGREARRAANNPVLRVPMTSELGNVTPALICPGMWTDKQLQDKVADMVDVMLDNGGHNCLTLRAVVISDEWHLVCLVHAVVPMCMQ